MVSPIAISNAGGAAGRRHLLHADGHAGWRGRRFAQPLWQEMKPTNRLCPSWQGFATNEAKI
jgi:hypothetical protein